MYKNNFKLRYYQQLTAELVRKELLAHRAACVCKPTGSGKTVSAAHIITECLKNGNEVWTLVDRHELLAQFGKTLYAYNGHYPHIVDASNSYKPGRGAYICMEKTMFNRMQKGKVTHRPKMVIVDECHKKYAVKLFNYMPEAYRLGLTATPVSESYSMKDYFGGLVLPTTTAKLIEGGYLCKPKTFSVCADWSNIKTKAGDYDKDMVIDALRKNSVFKGSIQNFNQICPWAKTIVFNVNVAHSKAVCARWNAAGISSEHVDGTMGLAERQEIMDRFSRNEFQALHNCEITTCGFDDDEVSCVVQNFKTKSKAKFNQTAGRCSRINDGHTIDWTTGEAIPIDSPKVISYIIDMGGNYEDHGTWDSEVDWASYYYEPKIAKKAKAPLTYVCQTCGSTSRSERCGKCDNSEMVSNAIKIGSMTKAQIVKAKKLALRESLPEHLNKSWGRMSTDELCEMAEHMGYKTGWIHRQLMLRGQSLNASLYAHVNECIMKHRNN